MTRPRSSRPSAGGFSSLSLDPRLERAVLDAGYRDPWPIQAATIPAVLEGRDVLGLAQTGTGKTAAFLLPILDRLLRRPGRGPRALVVAPTRELAAQIHVELGRLARHTPLVGATIFGGVGAGAQVRALRRDPDVLIACPGRLLDLWQQREVRLERIETLVLDEADHMFDMGFLPSIRRILAALPPRRQNLLFSATMPRDIRVLADRLLSRPHVVELGNSLPVETVDHALYPVAPDDKIDLLEHLLSGEDFESAIVFLRTKHRAKRLAQRLGGAGHRAIALQGNMSQGQRERAMQGFRDRRYDVLVATDIAARGIDVVGVSHVINFDLPDTPDAYTHRIGRTGRAERSGIACTFVTDQDAAGVRAIEQRLGRALERRVAVGFEGRAGARKSKPSYAARNGVSRSPVRPARTPAPAGTRLAPAPNLAPQWAKGVIAQVASPERRPDAAPPEGRRRRRRAGRGDAGR